MALKKNLPKNLNWINDIKVCWNSLSEDDKFLIYSSEKIFFELLDSKSDSIDPHLFYDSNDNLMAVMLVVETETNLSLIAFTNPNSRRQGLQYILLSNIKEEYKDKTLTVKVKNKNSNWWHEFWIKNGFNQIKKDELNTEYQIEL